MAKMTAKYKAALAAARLGGIKIPQDDAEELYNDLADAGYLWDARAGAWLKLADEPADEPSEILMIRCWWDLETVPEVADLVAEALKKQGFRLVKRSDPYPCHPPKHLEGRIYLEFLRNGGK